MWGGGVRHLLGALLGRVGDGFYRVGVFFWNLADDVTG